MIDSLHPAIFLLLGSLLLPLLPGIWRQGLFVLLPILGFLNLLGLEAGTTWNIAFAGYQLQILRVDKLSLLFGYLFHLAALLAAIYSLHVNAGLPQLT